MRRFDSNPSRILAQAARIGLLVALLVPIEWMASASEVSTKPEPFEIERFQELQKADALVLVDIAASWCPTCARQKTLVARYRAEHPDVPLHVLRVDYDYQKEWVRYFKAPRQSTLILYKGTEQVWFAVAETREEVLFQAFDEAAGR
jgi:thiol-disulfide isomerase/thioredoxin